MNSPCLFLPKFPQPQGPPQPSSATIIPELRVRGIPGGLPKPVSRSPDGPGTTLDEDWYGKISRTRCSVARFLFAEALLAHLVPPDNLESRLQKHRDCVFPFH